MERNCFPRPQDKGKNEERTAHSMFSNANKVPKCTERPLHLEDIWDLLHFPHPSLHCFHVEHLKRGQTHSSETSKLLIPFHEAGQPTN